jgi:hypothetical protein
MATRKWVQSDSFGIEHLKMVICGRNTNELHCDGIVIILLDKWMQQDA